MSNATHKIGAATRIAGSLTGTGDLAVAGAVEGNLQLEGTLLLEPTSQVVGDIAATQIRIGGKVTGNVQVDDKAILERSAELDGDLTATSLSIEAGASLRGRFEANRDATLLPPARPQRGVAPARESVPATERVSRPAAKKPASVAAPASTEQLALLSRNRVRADEE